MGREEELRNMTRISACHVDNTNNGESEITGTAAFTHHRTSVVDKWTVT